mmetsp:Transcript_3305/g.20593  ORF Transcript_3305/g.20593 Transcript_3305/m.20593 type:complete len:118 (+) Transcript_3305:19-372(+)
MARWTSENTRDGSTSMEGPGVDETGGPARKTHVRTTASFHTVGKVWDGGRKYTSRLHEMKFSTASMAGEQIKCQEGLCRRPLLGILVQEELDGLLNGCREVRKEHQLPPTDGLILRS